MVTTSYDPQDDYYAILQVVPSSEVETVKRSYKKMLLKFHPDKQPIGVRDLFHEPFTRIQNAYEVLGDSSTRRKYRRRRNSHYQNEFCSVKCDNTFSDWLEEKENEAWDYQHALISILNTRVEKHNITAKKVKDQEDELKKQQREEQKRRMKEQKEKEEKQKAEKSNTNGKDIQSIENIEGEMKEVKRDLEFWESRQKVKREKEVEEREVQLRNKKQDHLQDHNLRTILQQKKLKSLQKKLKLEERKFLDEQEFETKSLNKKQEQELQLRMDSQEKERQTQRLERKRVRDNYNIWYDARKTDINLIKAGQAPRKRKRKRPNFYSPSYGRTKNDVHCVKCKQSGGFCAQHIHQKW